MEDVETLRVKAAVNRALASQTRWIIVSQMVTVAIVMIIIKMNG